MVFPALSCAEESIKILPMFTPGVIAENLLRWFQKNKRPLPWRESRDPYRIWISEIMLQQTQVNTVIPYYEKWMKKFPTIQRLAASPLSGVLKQWEGLGYYSRARNLHETAKTVSEKFGGRFPETTNELQKLPGIGRYTAGAVASIAFNKSAPLLDGNVKRVLSRILALKQAVDTPAGENKLWETAGKIVAESRSPGDLNQALMELGALVCAPQNPQCPVCPMTRICRAHQLKREEDFPVKLRKQTLEKLNTVAAILWKKGEVLLEKQPLDARWGGLWMFPHWISASGKNEKGFLKDRVREKLGISIQTFTPRMSVRHGFTKYQVWLNVYEAEIKGRGGPCARPGNAWGAYKRRPYQRWVRLQELTRFALPRPHQKIAEALQNA